MSKFGQALSDMADSFFDLFSSLGSKPTSLLSSSEKQFVTWQNSAGQVVICRVVDRRELQNVAQAHIDSFSSYLDDVTPERRLRNAQATSEMFAAVAGRARVVEDLEGGNGKYRFTVRTEPGADITLV